MVNHKSELTVKAYIMSVTCTFSVHSGFDLEFMAVHWVLYHIHKCYIIFSII